MAIREILSQAESQMHAGEIDAAAKLFLQAIKADKNAVQAYVGLARASLFLGMTDEAEAYARAGAKVAPESGEVQTALGLVHEAKGEIEQAIPAYRRGAELAPDTFFVRFNCGRALAAAGRHSEGIPHLDRATELDPASYDAHYALGIAYKEAGLIGEAIEAFSAAMDVSPDNLDIYATLADVLIEERDLEMADKILREGLRRSDNHPALLERAASLAMATGNLQMAVDCLELQVKKLPDYSRAWLNLAHVYLLVKQLERSEEAGKRAQELDPKSWEPPYHLGNLYEALRLHDQAEKAYRRAVALAPNEYRPLGNLAGLLIQLDDAERNAEAAPLLERAIQLAPDGEWRLHYNLALAHVKLGETSKALDLLDLILQTAPPENEAVELARVLQSNLFEGASA